MHFIRSGRGQIVISGGSDASLTYGTLLGWRSLQAMAPDTCRPFSIDRKGMVLGEGALAEGRLAPRPADWAEGRAVLGQDLLRSSVTRTGTAVRTPSGDFSDP